MTGSRTGNAAREGNGGGSRPGPPPGGRPGSDENLGWTIFSYLIAGMLFYGAIGWAVGHWTGHPLIFPLGALAGLAIAVGLVIYRYGRS